MGPTYAWIHGARFLPMGPYFSDYNVDRLLGTPAKNFSYHATGKLIALHHVRTPEAFNTLHAWAVHAPRFQLPDVWLALEAGRAYKGKEDPCTVAVFNNTTRKPEEAYWWVNASNGF